MECFLITIFSKEPWKGSLRHFAKCRNVIMVGFMEVPGVVESGCEREDQRGGFKEELREG